MKALPVNLLATTGGSGKPIVFVVLVLAAVAMLASKTKAQKEKI